MTADMSLRGGLVIDLRRVVNRGSSVRSGVGKRKVAARGKWRQQLRDDGRGIVRVGDEVYMVGLGHFATVVRIIGGFHSSNVEVEYSSGFRETAFGADIVKVA